MRLLKFTSHGELSYAEFVEDKVPPYAMIIFYGKQAIHYKICILEIS